jgi:porin
MRRTVRRVHGDVIRSGRPRPAAWIVIVASALASTLAAPAAAQPIEEPKTYAGDLWSRPRLTGDWAGYRDQLAARGIRLDVDLLATPQGVASGGQDTGAEVLGNTEYTLNVDTGKAGLWPGGFLRVVANTGFGASVVKDSGAISIVNTSALLPSLSKTSTGLVNATFMQFLSPKFGLLAGKVDLIDGFQGEFTGNYRTQFLNAALTFPLSGALVPLSAYGGGIVALPWEGVVLSAMALDPSGTIMNDDVTDAFRDGVLMLGNAQLAFKPFGLVGHQGLAGMWSNKDHISLDQDPSNIARLLLFDKFPRLANPGPGLERIFARYFPGLLQPVEPLNQKSDTQAIFYNFDQYLWQPKDDPKRGIGVFFVFGASDGNPCPIKYTYSVGVGARGVIPRRPDDNFGVAWGRVEFSSKFVPFLRQKLSLGLEREDAIEMYYKMALTPWLEVTPDLQIINTAIDKTLGSDRRLHNVDTAVVAGLRIYSRF